MNKRMLSRNLSIAALLIPLLVSCRGGETPPIPGMPTGTYSETSTPFFSSTPPTPSATPSPTPSPAPTLTTTSTASALPTFSYPITPGPVINRDNTGRLALLGAVNAKTAPLYASGIRHQLDWSPDGREIVLASKGDGIRFIDPLNMKDTGGITEISGMAINNPGTVVYSPDGQTIATTMPVGINSVHGDIYFIDSKTHIENRERLELGMEILIITYNHTGKRMAIGLSYGFVVHEFNLDKWIFQDDDLENRFYDSASFSWDDRYLAFTGEYGTRMVNTNTWEFVKAIDDMYTYFPLCFSRDSKYFSSPPGIWSLDDFTLVKSISEEYAFDMCEYGKENDIVIGLDSQTKIQIWDVEKGEKIIEIAGQEDFIYDMVLSPDGRFIATAEGIENPMVKIWGIPAKPEEQ